MAAPGGCLAVDISTRKTGWAYRGPEDQKPVYGLWVCPGMADLGRLYATLRTALEDAFAMYQPARLVFAPALFRDAQTAARALGGLMAVAELAAWDFSVKPYEIAEGMARKAVLGRGSFGLRDPDNGNKIIKGTGSKAAKAAVMAWCHAKGWAPQTDDVGDSLVLLEYDRLYQRSRLPTKDFAA